MRNYYKKLTDDDFEIIPFAYLGDSREMSKYIKHRLDVVRKFIGRDISGLKTLDVGGYNKFGELLGTTHNTLPYDHNFRIEAPSDDYDIIFNFEIIEHLMNPLFMMIELRELLKPDGRMYISTPRPFFGFLQGPEHFTEYKPHRFERMMKFAGWKIVKRKKFGLWDRDFFYWGIRPFFRVLFHRTYIWEIKL